MDDAGGTGDSERDDDDLTNQRALEEVMKLLESGEGLEDIGDLVTYSQARFSPDAEVSLSKELLEVSSNKSGNSVSI